MVDPSIFVDYGKIIDPSDLDFVRGRFAVTPSSFWIKHMSGPGAQCGQIVTLQIDEESGKQVSCDLLEYAVLLHAVVIIAWSPRCMESTMHEEVKVNSM